LTIKTCFGIFSWNFSYVAGNITTIKLLLCHSLVRWQFYGAILRALCGPWCSSWPIFWSQRSRRKHKEHKARYPERSKMF